MRSRFCTTVVTLLWAGSAVAETPVQVYSDDFETLPVDPGWSNTSTAFDSDYTRFLGLFDNAPTQTSREFTMPAGATRAEIQFDFYRFDSWDNTTRWGFDRLQVEVDGTQRISLPFSSSQSARNGLDGPVSWSHVPLAAATNNAVNLTNQPWYQDQPHRFTLVVDQPGPTLSLTLRTFLNQGGNDESGGFDNVVVTAFVPPEINAAKSVGIVAVGPSPAYSIPGNHAVYTINITNTGGQTNAGSVELIDNLPPEVTLDTSNPIVFTDSANASGLSCCTPAQVDYSNTTSGPPVFGYTPISPLDPAVTYVRIRPSGAIRDSRADPATVSFELRTVIR